MLIPRPGVSLPNARHGLEDEVCDYRCISRSLPTASYIFRDAFDVNYIVNEKKRCNNADTPNNIYRSRQHRPPPFHQSERIRLCPVSEHTVRVASKGWTTARAKIRLPSCRRGTQRGGRSCRARFRFDLLTSKWNCESRPCFELRNLGIGLPSLRKCAVYIWLVPAPPAESGRPLGAFIAANDLTRQFFHSRHLFSFVSQQRCWLPRWVRACNGKREANERHGLDGMACDYRQTADAHSLLKISVTCTHDANDNLQREARCNGTDSNIYRTR